MARKKATVERLGELHGLVADSLHTEIQGYRDRDEPIPAALLAQAIKFLAENGIQATDEDPSMKKLKEAHRDNVTRFPFSPSDAA